MDCFIYCRWIRNWNKIKLNNKMSELIFRNDTFARIFWKINYRYFERACGLITGKTWNFIHNFNYNSFIPSYEYASSLWSPSLIFSIKWNVSLSFIIIYFIIKRNWYFLFYYCSWISENIKNHSILKWLLQLVYEVPKIDWSWR